MGEEALRELGSPGFNLFISLKGFGGIEAFESGGDVKSTIARNSLDVGSEAGEGEDEVRKD